jgi:Tfp pilus tip-associated adhesin PilY1
VPVASCTASSPTSGNNYTTTSCNTVTSALTPVSSCTPVAASSSNSYTATTCPITTTGPAPVSSCSASTASSTNSWTTTTCAANITTNVPVASCTASSPTSGNNWTTTTCSTNNTTGVAVSSCTASSPSSGNNWTTTTCPPETVVSGPTAVASCTPVAATSANGYQRTDCASITTTTPVPSGTCTPSSPTSGNNYTTTTCNVVTTSNVPVASCTPQTASSSNGWTQITCGTNNTSNVPVVSCTASAASSSNSWTTTSCPAPITTGPTPVPSCTLAAASSTNSYTSTTCPTPVTTGPTGVNNCSPVAASSSNSWTATICGTNNTTNVPVASCSSSPANGGNSWTATSCADNYTSNVPVASCSPIAASSSNSWTATTCPAPVVTSNVPVQTCTPEAASSTNNYTSRTCSVNATLNVPTGTCVADPAQSSNSWTETTCPMVVTGAVGVASCTPQAPSSSNSWTEIQCTPNNTSNVPVASCSPASPTSGNGYTTVTCSTNNTTNVPVASCSAGSPSSGNGYTTTTCTTNNTDVAVSSCTPVSPTSGNGWTTTACPVINTGPAGAASCSASGPTSSNGWTTTTCPTPVTTGPTPVASCTSSSASAGNAWTATTCSTAIATSVAQTCNDPYTAASSTNNWTSTTCTPVAGKRLVSTTSTRVREYFVSGSTLSLKSDTTTAGSPVVGATCHDPGTEPALPSDGPPAWTSADSTAYPSCSAWPCSVDDNTGTPRSVNSLADVAQYYYVTDLRTAANEPRGPNYYRDDVPGVGSGAEDDRVRWQHMTTFSIALGVSGSLQYRSDYKSATTGDFADIRSGVKNWPLWPDPAPGYYANSAAYNDPRSIDDFWHAAVNGRGTYFSASNPTSVIAGLAGALAGINARVAASTGAGASNLEPVAGDNFAYLANYTTRKWTGDVQSHEIDISTGLIQSPIIWSAQALLDAKTSAACDNRDIRLFRAGATDNLVNFSWNSRRCDISGNPTGTADTGLNAAEQTHFAASNVSLLSQHPSMTDGVSGPDQRTPAAGANLVNFLRGQRGFEDFTAADVGKLYRKRDAVLGDTVNAQPVYVRSPFASYADAGYAAFKTANAGRTPMLYVAANDGMLHAFYAGTSVSDAQGGKEAWAVVPSTVLPRLYKLADNNYQNVHEYFVDGTPSVSDVKVGGVWKTMLVGGLGAGGRGFYALDITDPTTPRGMWEFNWSNTCYDASNVATAGADCHLGLAMGRPLVTKLADGRWVVMVTSGYNNVNATPKAGDGKGYLYVLDAGTGQIIYKIATSAGDATTPSGLAQINNFVTKAEIDNTTVRVYGTDVLGNIWRFDVNDNLAPSGREATLIGTAKDAAGNPQPITVRPELTQLNDQPMLFVATGKLLGATDVSDLQTQSIYGIVDPLTSTTAYSDLRASMVPLAMTQLGSGTGATRTIACTGSTTQCGATNGWRLDLPDSGERVNVEMKLRGQTLVVGSNVPQISACTAGGYSWLNYLSYKSGLAVVGSPGLAVSEQVANSLIVGLTVIKVGGQLKGIVTTSDGGVLARTITSHIDPGTPKRVSWREVTR